MDDQRRGVALGAAAYLLWGLFPLYFPLLEPAGAVEILAHRVVWSCLTMGLVVLILRRRAAVAALVRDRRRLGLLAVAAVAISFNWGGYIYGTTHDRVVETALGYFINPLVTVLMGVLVLGERLRPLQWWALSIAGAAVVVLTVAYGRPPWIGLLLAFSFGTYGLAKKKAAAGAIESLAVETTIVAPVALGYLVWLGATGQAQMAAHGTAHALLFLTTGVVTAIPLLLFGAATTRVPLSTLGLLQYLAPILQFALGVLWFGEHMPLARWIGFVLVWIALVVFTVEALGHRRRHLRLTAAPV
ncbi:EamA family transporter RarD [Nocardioides acrostichi]|uniref:EamA family transporter RarD n=1 Tax=Nocardioides acrostichi TaxID=2784339 RepID=A0A930V3G2_9ACTN|nr:EamA family transporter RarD [Nocardioides acrostichi]MBF4162514.1 EamA family transporter RarD [Nocardioides acrostichi]